MSRRRFTRLCLVIIIAAGALGTILVLVGYLGGEGTMLFPVSVVGGMIGLWAVRPPRPRYRRNGGKYVKPRTIRIR